MLETDPLDLLLGPDGDLVIDGDVGFALVSGLDGVRQCVQIRLQLFKEEWFQNLDAGVPYYQEILGDKFNEPLLRQRLVEVMKGAPGVEDVTQLSIAHENNARRVTVTWALRTKFGDTQPDTLEIGGSNG